tara:strand:+ start:62 stop:1051 length:990 start_codon:yes stop_codon:yes gene_type:complete
MSKNFRLEKCILDSEWDNFIDNSPDQSIFVSKIYLENINSNLGLFKCFKGQEIRAIVVLCEDEFNKKIVNNNLLIYSGICFGAPTNNQNYSQQISERHTITNYIINQLTNYYESLDFQLSPNFIDIRPFLWHNYGEKHSNKFKVDIRYTSYLNLLSFKSSSSKDIELSLSNFSSSRRQQIRYTLKNNIITELSTDIKLFLSLYKKTLKKSDIELCPKYESNLCQLIKKLIDANKAKMYLSFSKDKIPASIAIIGFDKLRAYYLFGANNSDIKDETAGTAVLWHAFKELSAKGIKEIDLEGVNSPKRGWFKLSFGGELVPYFRIKYPYNN